MTLKPLWDHTLQKAIKKMSHRAGLVFSVFKEWLRLAGTSEVTLCSPCSSRATQHMQAAQAMNRGILNKSEINPPQPLRAACSRPWSPSPSCNNQTQLPVLHFVLFFSWTPLEIAQDTLWTPLSGICTHSWGSLSLSCELSSPRALSHTRMEFSVLFSSILFFKTFTDLNYTSTEPHLFLSWHIWRKKL